MCVNGGNSCGNEIKSFRGKRVRVMMAAVAVSRGVTDD